MIGLGVCNLAGVFAVGEVLKTGILDTRAFGVVLVTCMLRVLKVYAFVFLSVPMVRYAYVRLVNTRVRERNKLRARLAQDLRGAV